MRFIVEQQHEHADEHAWSFKGCCTPLTEGNNNSISNDGMDVAKYSYIAAVTVLLNYLRISGHDFFRKTAC